MKKLFFFALFCLLVFSPAFAAQKGWIIEFKESGSTPKLNLEIGSSVSWFESQSRSFGSGSVFGSLSDSLANTAIETTGFSLAAQNGIEGIARQEGIEMVCSGLELDETQCGSAVISEFSLLFNGAAMDISDGQAARVAKMPGIKSVTKNSEISASMDYRYPNWQSFAEIGLSDYRNLPLGSATGRGVKIAFIDTGIDFTHPAFGGCTILGFESGECKKITTGLGDCARSEALAAGSENCPSAAGIMSFPSSTGAPADLSGHGTAIASIAAGKYDPNNDNMQQENEPWGVAPDAEIIPLSIMQCAGDSPYSGMSFESDAIEALKRAVDPKASCEGSQNECLLSGGADVINISMNNAESTSADDPLAKAVDSAVEAGSVVVVSAGNSEATDAANGIPNSVSSPGTARKAITVGAYGGFDPKKFSSQSAGAGHFLLMPGSGIGITSWDAGLLMKPDVIAPGSAECAAQTDQLNGMACGRAGGAFSAAGDCQVEGYGSVSGTSVAAAYVSGLAAMVKEAHPDWSPLEIKMAIRNSAEDMQMPMTSQGFGLINVIETLSATDTPPVAMLEPLGVKDNEMGTESYELKGLAFGRDFKKYTVEVGQMRVFGTASGPEGAYEYLTPQSYFTTGRTIAYSLDLAAIILGDEVTVGRFTIPLVSAGKAVKAGWNFATDPASTLLSQALKNVPSLAELSPGLFGAFLALLTHSEAVDSSMDYHYAAQQFMLADDSTVQWQLAIESETPSTGVLSADFRPYKWLGGNEGMQMLKLTVYNKQGGKSVDYMPFYYNKPDLQGSGLNLKCEKTGEDAAGFKEKRNWLWAMNLKERDGAERTVDCLEKYCDAAQLYIFFAETQPLAVRALNGMTPSEKQFFSENISGAEKPKGQVLLDLSRQGFLVLPTENENEAQVFYATEKAGWVNWRREQYSSLDEYGEPTFSDEVRAKAAGDWQNCIEFSGEKPLRNNPAFNNPECTLDKDWAEFVEEAKVKALAGESIGELSNPGASPELSALESSARNCFGQQYGLADLYIDYSIPCDSKSARFAEWRDKKGALAERLDALNASLGLPPDFYLENRDPAMPYNEGAKFVSLSLFLEQQRQIATQIKRECDFAAGLCYLEIAGATPIRFSKSEIQGFFDFLEKHSFLQFGLSPLNKLAPEEMEFVEKNSIYKRGWNWAKTGIGTADVKLVSDALSKDFKKDFKEFFSGQLEEAGVNPDSWAVSVQNAGNQFGTGRYLLKSDFIFDSSNIDNIKISSASHSLGLREALSDHSNPFLFIPFDGEIGLENGRQGYGASIEFQDYADTMLYFTDEIPEINSYTPFGVYNQEKNRVAPSTGKDSGNIAKVKFSYSEAIDDIREGSILKVSKKGAEYGITVKHSIPVRVRFFAAPESMTEETGLGSTGKIYYLLSKTKEEARLSLEEYGAKKSIFTFFDFQGGISKDTVSEQLPACGNNGTYDKIVVAELEIPMEKIRQSADISPYVLPAGGETEVPLLSTIAFLPPGTELAMHCATGNIGELYAYMDSVENGFKSEDCAFMKSTMKYTGTDLCEKNTLAPKQTSLPTLSEIIEGVESEKTCANSIENGTDFTWNPVGFFRNTG
ncbi:MAG: S8 family serine peptidase [Candidatus Diapherotrites archaeon]|nr:S8 family serine peptidase [Candidatus Diapherotrites archaeon]